MDEIHAKVTIDVTADCGHKFPVSAVGLTPETDLVCPVCGAVDHFNADQIAAIERKIGPAVREAVLEKVRDDFSKGIAKAVRGKKGITYRPKR
jgi:hypothetical protein